MRRNFEDNTVFVLQKAIKRLRIKVSEESIKDSLLAHPYYPTLKSVCDALRKWGIEHYALKLNADEIKALEIPFIAHLDQSGGQLALVEKISKGKVIWRKQKGKRQISDFEEFALHLSGAIVLIEPGQNASDPSYRKNRQSKIIKKSLLSMEIIAILLFAAFMLFTHTSSEIQLGFVFTGLLFTKLLGITASLFLVLHELKIHTSLGDKLCGFSSKTDCTEVLASNASRLFGPINWADAGLIYFAGTLIYLLGAPGSSSFGILALISAFSLPYPVFSIYYQSVKLKKWCPFCLIVQLILVGEFLFLFPQLRTIKISGTDILRFVVSFILPAAIWIIFKVYYEESLDREQEHYSFLKLKRDPNLFLFLLKNNGYTELIPARESLVFGNPDAPVTITAFLSLYCNPCAQAFKKLKVLVDNCHDIKINAVFSVYSDDETRKVINTLYSLYNEQGSGVTLNFLEEWYSLPKQLRKPLYGNEIIPEYSTIAEVVEKRNKQLFDENKVTGTPTLYVNGYEFPKQYEYSDLEYHIEDIMHLTMESKRQEARVNCN